MSLQVWLPLNGNLNNQGLNSNIIPELMGTGITFTSGKIGQAATFPNNCNSCIHMPGFNLQEGSLCAWVKVNGESSGANQRIISEGRDSYSDGTELILNKAGTQMTFKAHKVSVSTTIELNKWIHVACIFGNNNISLFIDGIKKSTTSYTEATPYDYSNNRFVLGKMSYSYTSTANYFPFNGQLNDVRLYDHILSVKEIEEISKGLILHYKLDNNGLGNPNLLKESSFIHKLIQGHASDYSHPLVIYNGSVSNHTFEVSNNGMIQDTILLNSASNLGIGFERLASDIDLDTSSYYTLSCEAKCSQANSSLSIGLSYYKTDDTAVWRGGSNKKAFNAVDTWQKFTLTFKPDADTKVICYCFTVVGVSSGTDTWSIRACKMEKGSVATSWAPSPADLELDTTIIYDSSGYQNDSNLIGGLTISLLAPRYNASSLFESYLTPYTQLQNTSILSAIVDGSISWWEYCTTTGNSLPFVGQSGSYYIGAGSQSTRLYDSNIGTAAIIYKDGVLETNHTSNGATNYHGGIFHTQGSWHHFVLTNIDLSSWTQFYINHYSTGWPLNAYLSDVRIYCTALTAEQVKELYDTSATIDKDGNVYAREVQEI